MRRNWGLETHKNLVLFLPWHKCYSPAYCLKGPLECESDWAMPLTYYHLQLSEGSKIDSNSN